jgi:short subunit dehydrogenase
MRLDIHSARPVAIVTGGIFPPGREVARVVASWAWPTIIVYLDDQSRAEATVTEIIEAGGTTVAVRADLADDLDVQRLFTESIAAFGVVHVVVHTTPDHTAFLYEYAARYVCEPGVIVSTSVAEAIGPSALSKLRKRGITVGRVPPEAVLAFLGRWRQRTTG